jgi:hypothetical protein
VKVQADENVNEVVEALTWDFNKTRIQVRWKPHQSADSNVQVQIMCCPNVFDKEGLTKELLFHIKEVEKKLMAKGRLLYTLMYEPLPPISIQWQQSTQGKGRNKREKQLLLNNLPTFGQIGCLVLTVETEEGTWACLGPLWKALNSIGLVCRIFWTNSGIGHSLWWQTNGVRLEHIAAPPSVSCNICQQYCYRGAPVRGDASQTG